MRLSTKGRYGLKAMIDIAVYSSEKCISIKSIADRQNLSETYLEQLIALLRKANLVQSTRGAQGGYKLAKNADDIKVGDILRALEGSLAPVGCIEEAVNDCGDNCELCVSKTVWGKMYESINTAVDSITLGELAKDYSNLI